MILPHAALDAWDGAHFDAQVRFLQELVRIPTDTPSGDNAPHARRTAELLQSFDDEHVTPEDLRRATRVVARTLLHRQSGLFAVHHFDSPRALMRLAYLRHHPGPAHERPKAGLAVRPPWGSSKVA